MNQLDEETGARVALKSEAETELGTFWIVIPVVRAEDAVELAPDAGIELALEIEVEIELGTFCTFNRVEEGVVELAPVADEPGPFGTPVELDAGVEAVF